jgi:hypothetical protein
MGTSEQRRPPEAVSGMPALDSRRDSVFVELSLNS